MSTFIKDIKIKGGIHNRHKHTVGDDGRLHEEGLKNLVANLAEQIRMSTTNDSWIEIEFKKTIGTKINS